MAAAVCFALVAPTAWAGDCSNNCGTFSTVATTAQHGTFCISCAENCASTDCIGQQCGTGPYWYTDKKTTVTTYTWTGCAGPGATDCTGYSYTQGMVKNTQVINVTCQTIPCCFTGPPCKPNLYDSSVANTPEYDPSVKCICPGGE